MINSDKEWIRLGREDPYLTTLRTLDPYKRNLKNGGETDFFASGEQYVIDLMGTIEAQLASEFHPGTTVDFGCSVGRLALPLARRSGVLFGLDVSPDVLLEAKRNADLHHINNIQWTLSDDELSLVPNGLEFFHSYNVLQHIPVNRGLHIIERALERLGPGGVLAVHFPYADRASSLRKAINWAQANIPGVHGIANIARRRPRSYPHMYMNAYPLPAVLSAIRKRGCVGTVCRFVDQGRYPGVMLLARTPRV